MVKDTIIIQEEVGGEIDLTKTQAIYKEKCATCHGKNGKGDGPAGKALKATDFTDTTYMASVPDSLLAKAIKEGGKAVEKSSAMIGWGNQLSNAEISALVKYIRALAVSEEEEKYHTE